MILSKDQGETRKYTASKNTAENCAASIIQKSKLVAIRGANIARLFTDSFFYHLAVATDLSPRNFYKVYYCCGSLQSSGCEGTGQ